MTKINRDYLKALAQRLGRPLETLYALSGSNDPFIADAPSRRAAAEWVTQIWDAVGGGPGAHVRRIYYRMISQAIPIIMLNGEPFINTDECWNILCAALKDARYLDLIPADDLIDRRNAEPIINLPDEVDDDGSVEVVSGALSSSTALTLPKLTLLLPTIPQHYQIEIWCEKSTINDILEPLGIRYGINIVTGLGELSHTRCVELVKRAIANERPVRILYVSDFDPGGMSMPVAAARKIEFAIQAAGASDLDVQVRPIALTYEQCVGYRLPRTPLKASEHRGAKFEERFGEGATELDALEALHPGELHNILEREILRYYDDDLDGEIDNAVEAVEDDIASVNAKVLRRHAKDIARLKAEHKKLAAVIAASEKKMQPIIRKIERDLAAADVEIPDWPQPRDGDEDDDPLFDSTRDYVTQIDRYKKHQGKPTGFKTTERVCEVCGVTYSAQRSNSRACPEHRTQLRYLPGGERAPK